MISNTNFIFRLYPSTIWLSFESDLKGSINMILNIGQLCIAPHEITTLCSDVLLLQ